METTSQLLDLEKWRETLRNIWQDYTLLPYHYNNMKTYVSISRDGNHFLLVYKGWEDSRRVYGTIVHAEIRNDKIWIHYDDIENGITGELVDAGVPKDRIVPAFHPLEIRQHTWCPVV